MSNDIWYLEHKKINAKTNTNEKKINKVADINKHIQINSFNR